MTTYPSANARLWIRCFKPAPQLGVRLLCFPHAGGSASFFFPLAQLMAGIADVAGVQYPARQDRRQEPAVSDIHELADLIVAAVVDQDDARGLALFGHSMGAVVAFEVARRLQERGTPLVALFASGRRGPAIHREENVHQRDEHGLIEELTRLSGTDPSFLANDELRQMILPALRADYRAIETYKYVTGPRLACPIVGLVGDSDPRASRLDVEAWADETSSTFDLHVFPGDHFYLGPRKMEVTNLIRATLIAASGESPVVRV